MIEIDCMNQISLVKYEAGRIAIIEAKKELTAITSPARLKDEITRGKVATEVAKLKKDNGYIALAIDYTQHAERALGVLLAAMPKATGTQGQLVGRDVSGGTQVVPPENATPTLAELGISKNESARAQRYAAMDEDEFEAALQTAIAQQSSVAAVIREFERGLAHNHRAQGTGENEWYTPEDYIESARRVLGRIDLDPASTEIANARVKASKYFTKDDDGLQKKWTGNVWLNPPYSQPEIQQFSEKMVDSLASGSVKQAVMLTHNYTDTRWFQLLASASSAICFTKGRIGFLSPEGARAAPTQGQAFLYFGNDPTAFEIEFSRHGFVVRVTRAVDGLHAWKAA